MRNLTLVLSVSLLFAACSNLKKIETVSGNPIPEKLTNAQIVEAIIAGGLTRGWIIKKSESSESTLTGTLNLRRHMVEVEIPYTKSSYSIVYKDSEGMKYFAGENKIHKKYSRWILNLTQAIDLKLAIKASE